MLPKNKYHEHGTLRDKIENCNEGSNQETKKNKRLRKELQQFGFNDERELADLIEKLNRFANFIIDIYTIDEVQ
jgi:hypothetical protein